MVDLEFTGERLVPGKVEAELEIEHVSRYHVAAGYVAGREVLDLGCGTGYGTAILRRAGARRVLGIDRDPETVLYAASRFGGPGVTFCAGDCLRAGVRSERVDVVVTFEVIEHVEDYRWFLSEVRRILRPSGLLLLSTPNAGTYRKAPGTPPNPFHVHEFDLDELRRALSEVFPAVEILGQSRTEGAYFFGDRAARPEPTNGTLGLIGADQSPGGGRLESADHFVALCGGDRAALSAVPAEGCFYIADDNAVSRRNQRIVELQDELDGRTRWALQLQSELAGGPDRVAAVRAEIEAGRSQLEAVEGKLDAVERRLDAAERTAEESERRLRAELSDRLEEVRTRATADLAEPRSALERLTARERDRDEIVRWQRDSLALQRGDLERQRRDLLTRQEQHARLDARLAELTGRSEAAEARIEQLARRADRQDAVLADLAAQARRAEELAGRASALIDMLWDSRSWKVYTGVRRFFGALVPRRPARRTAQADIDDRAR